jgi:pectin methylesterase-like acyl-CoA thioesterase
MPTPHDTFANNCPLLYDDDSEQYLAEVLQGYNNNLEILKTAIEAKVDGNVIDNVGGTTYFINGTTGDDANDGLLVTTPFKTWAAVAALVENKTFTNNITINFAAGTYTEHIQLRNVICPSILIQGVSTAQRDAVVFTASIAIRRIFGHVNIQWCKVTGTTYGIAFDKVKEGQIGAVTIDGAIAYGLRVYATSFIGITGVIISDKTTAAIYCAGGSVLNVGPTCSGTNNQDNFETLTGGVIVLQGNTWNQFGTPLSARDYIPSPSGGQVILGTFDWNKLVTLDTKQNITGAKTFVAQGAGETTRFINKDASQVALTVQDSTTLKDSSYLNSGSMETWMTNANGDGTTGIIAAHQLGWNRDGFYSTATTSPLAEDAGKYVIAPKKFNTDGKSRVLQNGKLVEFQGDSFVFDNTAISTLYVDGTNGSDTNDGLTASTAFKTIQKACDQINYKPLKVPQDIYIAAGTYNEAPILERTTLSAVRIWGVTGDRSAVTITGTLTIRYCQIVFLEWITVKLSGAHTLYIDLCTYVRIRGCRFERLNQSIVVSFNNTRYIHVVGCQFHTVSALSNSYCIGDISGIVRIMSDATFGNSSFYSTGETALIQGNSGNVVIENDLWNREFASRSVYKLGAVQVVPERMDINKLQERSPLDNVGYYLKNGDLEEVTHVFDNTSISNLYVDGTNGNDSNTGLTIGTAFKTIQKAFDQVNNKPLLKPQTIRIAEGVYTESPILRGTYISSVTIYGVSGDQTKVQIVGGTEFRDNSSVTVESVTFISNGTTLAININNNLFVRFYGCRFIRTTNGAAIVSTASPIVNYRSCFFSCTDHATSRLIAYGIGGSFTYIETWGTYPATEFNFPGSSFAIYGNAAICVLANTIWDRYRDRTNLYGDGVYVTPVRFDINKLQPHTPAGNKKYLATENGTWAEFTDGEDSYVVDNAGFATWYVDPVNGDNANTGTTAAAAFKDLQYALNRLQNRNYTTAQTINLAAGTYPDRYFLRHYNGHIYIDGVSTDRSLVKLTGGFTYYRNQGVCRVRYVSISGVAYDTTQTTVLSSHGGTLELTSCKVDSTVNAAVNADKATHIALSDCQITGVRNCLQNTMATMRVTSSTLQSTATGNYSAMIVAAGITYIDKTTFDTITTVNNQKYATSNGGQVFIEPLDVNNLGSGNSEEITVIGNNSNTLLIPHTLNTDQFKSINVFSSNNRIHVTTRVFDNDNVALLFMTPPTANETFRVVLTT